MHKCPVLVFAPFLLGVELAEVRYPIVLIMAIHLAAFAVLAMACHARLAERRPDATHLTEYFVCLSLGGVLGGALAALVAPALLSSVLEYPLAIVAALLLRPQVLQVDRETMPRVQLIAWWGAAVGLAIAGYWGLSIFDDTSSNELFRASLAIPTALLMWSSRTALLAVDGRLGLRRMPEASYDLIAIDAFSSDAIPTHLITREAVAIYLSRVQPRGLIAFHISNRFFNLGPVLARIAADRGVVGYLRDDSDVQARAADAVRDSVWVVLARTENDLGQLARAGPRWVRLTADAGDPLWTDDYTSVLRALH